MKKMKTCLDCFEAATYWRRGSGRIYQCNRTGLVVDPGRRACALFVPKEETKRETTTQVLSTHRQPLAAQMSMAAGGHRGTARVVGGMVGCLTSP